MSAMSTSTPASDSRLGTGSALPRAGTGRSGAAPLKNDNSRLFQQALFWVGAALLPLGLDLLLVGGVGARLSRAGLLLGLPGHRAHLVLPRLRVRLGPRTRQPVRLGHVGLLVLTHGVIGTHGRPVGATAAGGFAGAGSTADSAQRRRDSRGLSPRQPAADSGRALCVSQF